MSTSNFSPQIYLAKDVESDELVLKQGVNPNAFKGAGSRVLIIGGGVTGLTTAWVLLDAGYAVTVVSERWASLESNMDERITSQVAGALWEWPPAVCGRHTDVVSLRMSKRWCMTSYHILEHLVDMLPADGPLGHGVRMRVANFFFDKSIEEREEEWLKMREIQTAEIRGFERNPSLVSQHAIGPSAGVVDAYKHLSPVIDTDAYMLWLRALIAIKGCKFITARINGDLLEHEDTLLRTYDAQVIVNCTGLSAFELAADETVYALRGALLRVVNDGTRFPIVSEALVVAHDNAKEDEDGGIVFIVPRNDQTLVLGGIAEPNEDQLDLTLSSPSIVRMQARCSRFVSGLADAVLDSVCPLVQGLRPCRGQNVRVERELRKKKTVEADGAETYSRIVHSYGQGGAGFTLSFGCASDVLDLVREIEANVSPAPMTFSQQSERK